MAKTKSHKHTPVVQWLPAKQVRRQQLKLKSQIRKLENELLKEQEQKLKIAKENEKVAIKTFGKITDLMKQLETLQTEHDEHTFLLTQYKTEYIDLRFRESTLFLKNKKLHELVLKLKVALIQFISGHNECYTHAKKSLAIIEGELT